MTVAVLATHMSDVSLHDEALFYSVVIDGVKELRSIPLFDLERVIVSGYPNVTLPAILALMSRDIPVYFVSEDGRWKGAILTDKVNNTPRKIAQFNWHRNDFKRLIFAKNILTHKIRNSRRVLQKLTEAHQLNSFPDFEDDMLRLMKIQKSLFFVNDLPELRGKEGAAANLYFKHLNHCFCREFPFENRSRRPPLNPSNALLSFAYAIVLGEIEALLRIHSIDPSLGALHDVYYNRPSLALDLLEMFRAPLCDLMVLNILNHHRLSEKDFIPLKPAGFHLTSAAQKIFFSEYDLVMTREFLLPKNPTPTSFRKIIEQQVLGCVHLFENNESMELFKMP